jgi:hypothetical protein
MGSPWPSTFSGPTKRLPHNISKKIWPEFERNYVDVEFSLKNKNYIGEVKVSGLLDLNLAFRMALGQLLEYAYLRRVEWKTFVLFTASSVA